MVTDHKGRIIYVTSKLAELLGSNAKALLRTDFSRLMAQPFMQLHSKWMKVREGGGCFFYACACVCVCLGGWGVLRLHMYSKWMGEGAMLGGRGGAVRVLAVPQVMQLHSEWFMVCLATVCGKGCMFRCTTHT
jgi:hypothetical protein